MKTISALHPNPDVSLEEDSAQAGTDKCFIEFFAGIGLVEEGLRSGGWKCIYANDNDPRKREMHAARNGPVDHFHLADVRDAEEILSRIVGQPALATASFPCTDMSLAGNYKGFEGVHSSAFFAFLEVIRRLGARRPGLILLENVLGFLTSQEGGDFRAVAIGLAELGYWLDAFVLDAKHFTPQSRPRVFVVAMSEEYRPPLSGENIDLFSRVPLKNALRTDKILARMEDTALPTGWWPLKLPATLPARKISLVDVIDTDDSQDWWEPADVRRHLDMMSDLHRGRISAIVAAKGDFVGTIFRRVRHGSLKAEVRFDDLAGCLRTPKGGSAKQIVLVISRGKLRMRWMSPREYARLQGAPDFPLTLPTNQLLYGFGDAVCVTAIEWIDRHVLTPLYDANRAGL